MTNILPTEGATVNGALCRFARLEDEDVVQLGQFQGSSHLQRHRANTNRPGPAPSGERQPWPSQPATRNRRHGHTRRTIRRPRSCFSRCSNRRGVSSAHSRRLSARRSS